MGRVFQHYLEGEKYSCKHCGTHLALANDIRSTIFHCTHGMDYLFNKVVNVTTGKKEERLLRSGMHTVADIYCVSCGSILGWKYAHEDSHRYMLGIYVLQRFKVLVPDGSCYPTCRCLKMIERSLI